MQRQAALVAKWMAVGFIHGVMNTDNVQIAGETIDYGPCAFMDAYHPDRVFSSIDHQGRYAYSNQAPVTHWNLAQFATALVPIMADQDAAIEEFTQIINRFPRLFQAEWLAAFAPKLGLAPSETADGLAQSLLEQMADQQLDFTNTFADLHSTKTTLPDWHARWRAAAPDDALWQRTNPKVIPRTHKIEQAITAATAGDLAPFHTMLKAVSAPFEDAPAFMRPPTEEERVERTFCGT